MKKYIIRRLLQLLPILLGITLLSFLLMNMGTADVIDVMENNTGGALSEEEKDVLRAELGLDRPILEQYVIWLGKIVRGDMGESFVSGQPVSAMFVSKLPATICLTITSILLTVLLSIPLGILSAVKQNRLTDYIIRFLSFIGNSLPNFFCVAAADLFLLAEAEPASGYGESCGLEERDPADADAGAVHGLQVYQAGAGDGAGRAE